jgi:iron complex transport system substrate-binding protein
MSTIRSERGVSAVFMLLALLALAALAGCGSSGDTAASPSASAGPITVTDDGGNQVTLQQPAERIVSLAPANTEIVYAIGAGDKMVAGTSYDDYPEEAKALPKVGDLVNPSVERIVSFEPNLVLAAAGIQKAQRNKLADLGVQVFVVDPTSYDGAIATIEALGKLTGKVDGAAAVAAQMTQVKDDVQTKVASLDRTTAFLEIYSEPLMTAGTGTFIDDLITLAGGTNIGAAAGSGFPNFSSEVLLEEDPAVYIADSGSMSEPGEISKRAGFDELTAVKGGRVYVIDDNIIARPGPRLAEGLQELAKMIHPEAYETQ